VEKELKQAKEEKRRRIVMKRLTVFLACVVIALTLVAVATGASAAPKQQKSHFYGALDYSKAKGALYWGHGTSKAAANKASYNVCKKDRATDCQTVVWVYNGYIAYAESRQFFDVGWGATKQKASNAAVKRCESGGAPSCKATDWWNTDIRPNTQATGGYKLPGP
jgi:Domain of unknown function (DUF4189)